VKKELSAYFSKLGKKGGRSRSKKLSKERKQEIARNAARTRWASFPQADA
jgi:hypothetical protein